MPHNCFWATARRLMAPWRVLLHTSVLTGSRRFKERPEGINDKISKGRK